MLSRKFVAAVGVALGIVASGLLSGNVVSARDSAVLPPDAARLHPATSISEPVANPTNAQFPLPCSLEQLARLSWQDLECLYRQSATGTIPEGYLRGRAIYRLGSPLAGVRSKVTHLLWHGKDFSPADGTLINQWCGVRAIRARVGYGPSWLDGGPAVIMDYRGMSRVWADVRDEIREVAPGLYLGAMYRRRSPCPKFVMFFALQARPCAD